MSNNKTLKEVFENVNFFGVRHLSPSSSYHLLEYLDKIKPKAVLIEGPVDANDLIKDIVSNKVQLPIGILAYTNQLPVSSVVYPFSEYSPEYQGLLWAKKNKAYSSFIDLPTDISMTRYVTKEEVKEDDDEEKSEEDIKAFEEQDEKDRKEYYDLQEYHKKSNEAYEYLAHSFNEESYDEYWESSFEQIESLDEYLEKLHTQSKLMRELMEGQEEELAQSKYAHNMLREKFMAKNIVETINKGYEPSQIVVITGAYHTSGLQKLDSYDDVNFDKLPKEDTSITLMPYSYYKLSSLTGYGAGNKSPLYYEDLWNARLEKRLSDNAYDYLVKLGIRLREKGFTASTASIIESVRLSKTLASIRNHKFPTYDDVKDAAVTCLGEGTISGLADSLTMLNIGMKIGNLEEGVSKTPIQDDFNRHLKELNLEKYKKLVPEVIKLDLRENVKVKSTEKAFQDLYRSIFFNKLELLGIDFAKRINKVQDGSSWSEQWELSWSPEVEIKVIETIFKGETINIATAYEIAERLKNATKMSQVASIIRIAYNCNLVEVVKSSIYVLDNLFVNNDDFGETCETVNILFNILKYKDIRNVDMKDCENLFKKIYTRCRLIMYNSADCDDKQGETYTNYINDLYKISQEMPELVDYDLLIKEIDRTAFDDSKNPIISGICFSILMEKNKITNSQISVELSRRLSVGTNADLGASWFMGVCKRNRYGLLSKVDIWQSIDTFLDGMDDDEFKRIVIFFRRVFMDFTSREKNGVVELLGDLWGVSKAEFAEVLLGELTEKETEVLSVLDDFDFGDLL